MAHDQYQDCVEACEICVVACEHCATACLEEVDVSKMKRCIALDRSCADICALAVREMARDSEFAPDVCRVCADVCAACAEECSHHSAGHCRKCAEACQRCASECEKMAATSASIGRHGR